MHWPIIQTLLGKELRRLAAHCGALAVMGLLLTGSLLVAAFDLDTATRTGVRLNVFWVDHWQDGPWVEHLRANVPPALSEHIRFRRVADIPTDKHGTLQYGRGEGAVQLRLLEDGSSSRRIQAWFWYAGDDAGLAPYEEWFWRETYRFGHDRIAAALPTDRRPDVDAVSIPAGGGDSARLAQELYRLYRERLAALAPDAVAASVPEVNVERSALHGLTPRPAAVTGLILFGLFFTCALVLPSLTCEEKEQGTLLAQALSPASAADMLAAKAIGYVGLGALLAVVSVGLCQPTTLLMPFFCLTLGTAAVGVFGLGVAVASLAHTQRGASTAVLGYGLAVATLTVIGQRGGISGLTFPLLESRLPSLFYAALNDAVAVGHWRSLVEAMLLAGVWAGTGVALFRRNLSR